MCCHEFTTETFLDCFLSLQIFRAPPGKKLSVHFRLISGSEFELNITDGRTSNKTMLSRITNKYNGKTIKSGSYSVLELHFYSKGNARLEMIILQDQGRDLDQK